MAKLQIQIVTWNSLHHLKRMFFGIDNQKIDCKILVIDNNSQDGTKEWLKQNRQDVELIENTSNIGFAQAHNIGFSKCAGDYVLALNPDTELMPGFLTKALDSIAGNEKIGALSGKLYNKLPDANKYGIIDSCGLKIGVCANFTDIGHNKTDKGQYAHRKVILGPSGACALYRVEALNSVKDQYGIFDERFGSYKEDIDLAWRLKKQGWLGVFEPKSIAWHNRGTRKNNRQQQDNNIKLMSVRNHLLMLKKNLSWADCWRFPFILGYELLKFIYIALFERQTLKAYKQVISRKA